MSIPCNRVLPISRILHAVLIYWHQYLMACISGGVGLLGLCFGWLLRLVVEQAGWVMLDAHGALPPPERIMIRRGFSA